MDLSVESWTQSGLEFLPSVNLIREGATKVFTAHRPTPVHRRPFCELAISSISQPPPLTCHKLNPRVATQVPDKYLFYPPQRTVRSVM